MLRWRRAVTLFASSSQPSPGAASQAILFKGVSTQSDASSLRKKKERSATSLTTTTKLKRALQALHRRPLTRFPLPQTNIDEHNAQDASVHKANDRSAMSAAAVVAARAGEEGRRTQKKRQRREKEMKQDVPGVKAEPLASSGCTVTWEFLQPTSYLTEVRVALISILLSSDRPLSVDEVLSRFQSPRSATVAVAKTKQKSANQLAFARELTDWVAYIVAVQEFQALLCAAALRRSRRKKNVAQEPDEQKKIGIDNAPPQRKERRAGNISRRDMARGVRQLLSHSVRRLPTKTEEQKKVKERILCLHDAIVQDCMRPPLCHLGRVYKRLYQQCVVSLFSDEESSEASTSKHGMGWMKVSRWAPLALLLTDPLFRVVQSSGGGDAVASTSQVCFPVQPSVLMASMDPMKLPSLMQVAKEVHEAALTRCASGHDQRQQQRWSSFSSSSSLAATLAHCTDVTRALAGLAPPPRPKSLPARSPGLSRAPSSLVGNSEEVLTDALVNAWLRWAGEGSGALLAVIEEGIGVHQAAVPAHLLPSLKRDGGQSLADRSLSMNNSFVFPPSADRNGTSRGSNAEGWEREVLRHDDSGGGSAVQAASEESSVPDAQPPRKLHKRSADGHPNELLRRATGWNEAVTGNPALSIWAEAAEAKPHADFLVIEHVAKHPESPAAAAAEALLQINRTTLQVLFQTILVTPISLARLSTVLRWNVTCRFAHYYHGSLLYFLLLYAGNPTVCAAQEREERQLALLTPSSSSITASSLPGASSVPPATVRREGSVQQESSTVVGRRGETERLLAVFSSASAVDSGLGLAESFEESKEEVLRLMNSLSLGDALVPSSNTEECPSLEDLPSSAEVSLALERAAEWERSQLTMASSGPVLTHRHAVRKTGGSARGRDGNAALHAVNVRAMLAALTTCPVSVGRLLFVRRLRQPLPETAPARKGADGEALCASAPSLPPYRFIEVLDTDHCLPQDTLAHLLAVVNVCPPAPQDRLAAPLSTRQRLENELAEDLFVFPLSRKVFLARAYSAAAAFLQQNLQQQQQRRKQSQLPAAPTHRCNGASGNDDREGERSPLTVRKMADLMLWSFEFGAGVSEELMVAYLLCFPDLVTLRRHRPSPAATLSSARPLPMSKWEVVFTV